MTDGSRRAERRQRVWRVQGDRLWLARRARGLMAVVATSIGATVALVVLAARTAARPDTKLAHVSVSDGVIAALTALAFGLAVAFIARSRRGVGWPRDLARRSLPVPERLRDRTDAMALAIGVYRPQIVVVPGVAVNAAVAGRGDRTRLLLTEAACHLDDDLLDALLSYCMAMASDRALAEAQAAAASVTVYTTAAQLLWGVAAFALVTGSVFGRTRPWVPITAAAFLGLVAVFVFGMITTVLAARLSREASDIADSDAVAITMRPDMYAALLIGLVDDPALTPTRTSPLLWLERATTGESMAAVFGSYGSQRQIVHRARRMCAVSGVPVPDWWA